MDFMNIENSGSDEQKEESSRRGFLSGVGQAILGGLGLFAGLGKGCRKTKVRQPPGLSVSRAVVRASMQRTYCRVCSSTGKTVYHSLVQQCPKRSLLQPKLRNNGQ